MKKEKMMDCGQQMGYEKTRMEAVPLNTRSTVMLKKELW